MEWVLGIIGLALIGGNVYNGIRLTKIEEQQTFIKNQLKSITARRTQIAHAVTSHQSPGVDAKGRTTRRDTDDLPLAGRQRSTTTRKTADYGQPTND